MELEYEGALDFVKFRSRRSAAGALDAQTGRLSGCSGGALCRGWLRRDYYDGGRGTERVFHRRSLQYFPDKQTIAFTLVNQYSQEVEAHWRPLMEQAETLTHAEFADLFIERITQFVQERPAYLKLLAAPIRFSPRPCCSKGFAGCYCECVPSKEPVAVERSGDPRSQCDASDRQGDDDTLRRIGAQGKGHGCG